MEERNLQAIDGATLMGLHLEPHPLLRGHTAAPGGVLSGRGVQDWQVLDGAGLVCPHRQGGAGVGVAHPEGDHPVPVSGGHPPPGAGQAEPHHRGGAGERLLLRQAETMAGACWRRSAVLWGSTRTPCWWRWTPSPWCVPLEGTRPMAATIRRCAS